MTTEDDFRRAIDANPEDWQTLLVFSDWLREQNDPRADGYAALVRHRKQPEAQTMANRRESGWNGDWFRWASAWYARRSSDHHVEPDDPDALAPDWYDATKELSQLPNWPPAAWSYFRSRFGALDAAARGFAKLPAERRAELLSGGDAT